MLKTRKLTLGGVAGMTFLLLGCGSGGEDGAPPRSTADISPPSVTWNQQGSASAQLLTQRFTVTLKDARGIPLPGTDVDIYLDLSSGTWTGSPAMILKDENGNPQTSPFSVKTDAIGTARVLVEFVIGGGADYKGSVQAFSGSAYRSALITVTCEDTDTATPVCD